MAGFARLARLDDLSPSETTVVDHNGQKVMLVRLASGGVHAYDARCPHANTIIPAAAVGDDLVVECPMHGAIFSLENGARLDGPTCGDLVAWPARVVDGYVEVDVPERVISNDWRPASWGTVKRARS